MSTQYYLIRSDDRPLAIVGTSPWYGPEGESYPEKRIINVQKRLTSPIFPITFTTIGYRQVKTFIGETVEEFRMEGFAIYPMTRDGDTWYIQLGDGNGPFRTMNFKTYLSDYC